MYPNQYWYIGILCFIVIWALFLHFNKNDLGKWNKHENNHDHENYEQTADNITSTNQHFPKSNMKGNGTGPKIGLTLDLQTCGWWLNETVGGDKLLLSFELRLEHTLTCKEIFQRWMDVNLKTPPNGTLPREIPVSLHARYTLNDTVTVQFWFVDERKKDNFKLVWTEATTDAFIKALRAGEWTMSDYSTDAVAHAMQLHKPRGQGLTIGSQSPWVEATAIFSGADHVLTATYKSLESNDSRISAIHPNQMAIDYAKYLNTFDFAVSYSSIEHSGLGRYGDNLDPEGDILEMQRVRCWLNEGGLFYFGVPVSVYDVLVWNVHRIYGPLRLPYMYSGFDIVSVIGPSGGVQLTLKQALESSKVKGYWGNQVIVVLKKTKMTKCG